MTILEDINAEIARLQAKKALLLTIPEDTFPFKTIVIFAAASGEEWHYIKRGEELWEKMKNSIGDRRPLAEWILRTKDSSIGYFEVYALIAEAEPFFASS